MIARADLRHIAALTDGRGTFEHARFDVPRRAHGYCTDDVARVLLVASREPDPQTAVVRLAAGALSFVAAAQGTDGTVRNRRRADGRWHGRRGVEDCWGRSLWALGVASTQLDALAPAARICFDRGAACRSPWPRAMAYASLGAAAVLRDHPGHTAARALLVDAVAVIGSAGADESWPWPEPRLTYANAVLPDALLAAGVALERPELVAEALRLLSWLLDRETIDGHLSVTPAGGAGPGDGPGFDQQPIEVATLAEACARAAAVTGDARWGDVVARAAAWFDGENDAGLRMWDPATGGAYDGLHRDAVNLNQGAESTLALVATRQLAARRSAPVAS